MTKLNKHGDHGAHRAFYKIVIPNRCEGSHAAERDFSHSLPLQRQGLKMTSIGKFRDLRVLRVKKQK